MKQGIGILFKVSTKAKQIAEVKIESLLLVSYLIFFFLINFNTFLFSVCIYEQGKYWKRNKLYEIK
jgi:hypothetical protein